MAPNPMQWRGQLPLGSLGLFFLPRPPFSLRFFSLSREGFTRHIRTGGKYDLAPEIVSVELLPRTTSLNPTFSLPVSA